MPKKLHHWMAQSSHTWRASFLAKQRNGLRLRGALTSRLYQVHRLQHLIADSSPPSRRRSRCSPRQKQEFPPGVWHCIEGRLQFAVRVTAPTQPMQVDAEVGNVSLPAPGTDGVFQLLVRNVVPGARLFFDIQLGGCVEL